VQSDSQFVYVAGLPDEIDVISVGHGYVKDGQNVTVEFMSSAKVAQK